MEEGFGGVGVVDGRLKLVVACLVWYSRWNEVRFCSCEMFIPTSRKYRRMLLEDIYQPEGWVSSEEIFKKDQDRIICSDDYDYGV